MTCGGVLIYVKAANNVYHFKSAIIKIIFADHLEQANIEWEMVYELDKIYWLNI